MSDLFVQFSDSTESTVCAYFAGPQDPNVYPNQGTVDTGDTRWVTYFNDQPASAQRWLPRPTVSGG